MLISGVVDINEPKFILHLLNVIIALVVINKVVFHLNRWQSNRTKQTTRNKVKCSLHWCCFSREDLRVYGAYTPVFGHMVSLTVQPMQTEEKRKITRVNQLHRYSTKCRCKRGKSDMTICYAEKIRLLRCHSSVRHYAS